MNTLSHYIRYSVALSFGLFWSIFVVLKQIHLLFKNGFVYFKAAEPIKCPACVNDKKYGKSSFVDVKTTKGKGEKTTLKLHYVISGENKKETMLLLHGFPEFWFSWRYQITEFKKSYRVIALDMRGYGLSDKPSNVADYQVTHIVNDIRALLECLGIKSVILVAHDWGGTIGWHFESCYPEMVKKFIALNIPYPTAFRKILRSDTKQFLKSWYINFFQLPFLPEWIMSRFNYQFIADAFTSDLMGLKKTKLSDEEIVAFRSNMSQEGALTAGINFYRAILRFPSSRLKVNATAGETKYMLIFGEEDGAIEVAAATESKVFLPSLTLKLLPGLSHWVQQDDPSLVNSLINDFINNV